MARTVRRKPYRFYAHEGRYARALTRRLVRRAFARALRAAPGDPVLPRVRGTSGWMTW